MGKIYNLYITFGTIPAFYAQINTILDKKPSYIWAKSAGNFNVDKFKDIKNLKYYHIFTGFDKEYVKDQYNDVLSKIKEIISEDSNAKFIIYIDDSRVQFMLKPIILADAIDRIKKVVIISEGNISEYMYSSIDIDYEKKTNEEWSKLIDNIKTNAADNDLIKIKNYCFWLSTKKNVEFLLPHANLLENKNVSNEYKKRMNLKKFDIEEKYKKVPEKYKEYIFGSDFLKYKKLDKTLIILGTYDFGDKHLTSIIYENLIGQILVDYKNKYNFMFKAHPLFPVSKNKWLNKFLEDNNISIMSEKIPLEPILWDNKKLVIGGFCSSINSIVEPLRTKFFFGEKLGFSYLLDKNEIFKAKDYNVIISQKLASGMLNLYYDNVNKENQLKEKVNILDKKCNDYNSIINKLQEKQIENDKRINELEKINLQKSKYNLFNMIRRR